MPIKWALRCYLRRQDSPATVRFPISTTNNLRYAEGAAKQMRLAELTQLGTNLPVFVNPDQVVCVVPYGEDLSGTAITTTARADAAAIILVVEDLTTTVGKLEGIL